MNDKERGDQESGKKIEVIHSQGTNVGNNLKIKQIFYNITQIDPDVHKHLFIGSIAGFVGLALLMIGLTIFAVNRLQHPDLGTMTGTLRIAVAGFAKTGQAGPQDLGKQIAGDVTQQLQGSLSQIGQGSGITVWGPDKVGGISGATADDRDAAAQAIVQKRLADVVVYGVVDTTHTPWTVSPEFYLAIQNSYEAQELSGPHRFGEPVPYLGPASPAGREELGDQMVLRTQALADITMGLDYYAQGKYPRALEYFSQAEQIPGWQAEQGKEFIYLFLGNTSTRMMQFDQAAQYYQASLAMDPQYARGMIGLAGTLYIKAVDPFEQSKDPARIDLNRVDESIHWYQSALQAADRPPLADVESKVHFGMGQCLLLKGLAGDAQQYGPAWDEFTKVITAYGSGRNPRLKELAGESHGRRGLIRRIAGNLQEARQEYQQGLDLLGNFPDRQKMMQNFLAEIDAQLGKQRQ